MSIKYSYQPLINLLMKVKKEANGNPCEVVKHNKTYLSIEEGARLDKKCNQYSCLH